MVSKERTPSQPRPGRASVEHSQQIARSMKRLHRLAWLLDGSIRLPGGLRIGADGILGLIPGVGDFAAAAVSSYIIYEARAAGVPRRLLWRMAGNTLVDAIIGAIPIAGDLFDFYFKANLRNMRLLEDYWKKA